VKTQSFLLVIAVAAGCASSPRRFPLRTPMWRDGDLDSRSVPCRPDKPDKNGKPHQICRPEEYVSSFFWDGADNILFRQIAWFFAVDPAGDAVNVNAFDEVPDSSWFTNRIGVRRLSEAELISGSCGGQMIDVDLPDAAIVIDQGKPNGANPGFRIKMPDGTKYMLKADGEGEPERATGATSIATRLYYAAGFYAACDTVVYIRPSSLKLTPGLKVTDNQGRTHAFDQHALEEVMKVAAHRGEMVRFAASRWLEGRPIGPFTYRGIEDDDPADVVKHEDRRDLRGAKLLSAWTSHYDSREQNSLSSWMADNDKDPDSSPGKVIHYIIDLGDTFGGLWDPDSVWRRMDRSYIFDPNDIGKDFITFGLWTRSWERVEKSPTTIFGYYSDQEFDPENWYGMYPNPAFQRMTERDGAWMARIIARFTDADLATLSIAGNFTDPAQTQFLIRAMAARRDLIVKRYLARVSPITDLAVDKDELCGVDLARRSGVFAPALFAYRARASDRPAVTVTATDDARVCVPLAHRAGLEGRKDDDAARYLTVEIDNHQAPGILRAHLYDLGAERGFMLVGIERPEHGW
jgi:hypothetical protein